MEFRHPNLETKIPLVSGKIRTCLQGPSQRKLKFEHPTYSGVLGMHVAAEVVEVDPGLLLDLHSRLFRV